MMKFGEREGTQSMGSRIFHLKHITDMCAIGGNMELYLLHPR